MTQMNTHLQVLAEMADVPGLEETIRLASEKPGERDRSEDGATIIYPVDPSRSAERRFHKITLEVIDHTLVPHHEPLLIDADTGAFYFGTKRDERFVHGYWREKFRSSGFNNTYAAAYRDASVAFTKLIGFIPAKLVDLGYRSQEQSSGMSRHGHWLLNEIGRQLSPEGRDRLERALRLDYEKKRGF